MFTRLALMVMACLALPTSVWGAFGLTTATDFYTVDTGAGFVFKVRRTDNGVSTQSAGDLMSLVYNGVEYQNQSRGSQINSGFDFLYTGVSAVTVSAAVVNVNYIKVTVQAGNLTHYYLARNGYPHIYMATHFATEPDTLGLCRYIVRIPENLLPNGPIASDIRNNTGAIESADIFGMADGTTRSKHYSNMRLKDWSFIGTTGTNVGVFMLRSSHEGDSGGPFYRSLLNQCGSDQEITYIVNYGEAQTEAFRTNILNGPYTLAFTGGGLPSTNVDYSWIESGGLNLTNWVSNSARGAVKGTVSGVPTGFEPVVGFANGQAQYWAVPGTNGSYTSPLMIPGSYTVSLYKQEFVVATTNVTVTANVTNTVNVTSAEATPTYIWKLGEWDGTPAGFLNADKVTTMHPSDVRMSSWNPGTFVVGSSTVGTGIPAYQWKDINLNQVIQFNLTAAQVVNSTLRIGITVAFEGARPKVQVNAWSSSNPSASAQPDTRTLTVGTYRGNNTTYTFAVPASGLVAGLNTLTVFPISGSGASGYLSAGYSIDCIEWDGPVVSAPTTPSGLAATAGNRQVNLNWNQSPAATSYNIKRATISDGPFLTIASGVKASTYTDNSLVNGTTYYYEVSAVNSMGESGDSSPDSAVPSDLFAHWKFDESSGLNAADSAAANDGTLASANATWVAGKTNNAVKLNGTANSYVSFPTGLVSTLNDFTMATWVKVDTNALWARIFDFGTGTGNYMFLAPVTFSSNTVRYAITTASTGGEQQINTTATLSTGVWHHVAVTLSGNLGVLYLDGAAVGTNTNMTLRPSTLGSTTQNYIGKAQWPDPNLIGLVDDFRIYNRALSAPEIAAFVTPPALPAAPSVLIASGGGAQVDLNWTASAGAASYNVKRSTGSGGPYTTVASGVTSTNYSDLGVLGGTNYFYVVSAMNSTGEGINSVQAIAVPYDFYAYWKFDETSGLNAADVAGAHNGTLSAGATWLPGKFNNAVKLSSATNSYVSFPTGLVSTLNDFTIATWVKMDTNATWARTFDFGTGTGNYMFLAPAVFGNTVRYAITTSSGGGEQQINNNAVLSTGIWHHVAVTLSGTVGVLYIDGVAAGTNSAMTLRPSTLGSTTQNYLGKSQYPDPNLIGTIDDFRIYRRGLSAAEIYSLATPAMPAGLMASAGDAKVTLNWTVSPGATSYRVKRSFVSGGPYTVISTNLATSFTNSGLANGTTYHYVVSAVNEVGEGANSVQVSANPTWTTPPNIAEWIYALTVDNQLISFGSTTPGNILAAYTVSGLQANEKVVGLDFWNGTLYGLGDLNNLYTINRANGAAGLVGSFSPTMNGEAFGFDAEPGGLRLVSNLDQNLLLNYGDGTATTGATLNGSPNPALTGLAYHPGNGQRYVADYSQNTIGLLDAATGLASSIGLAGIDFSRHNGFDISSNPGNAAYLASPASSSGLAANLYKVDLTTGSATLVGLVGLPGDDTLIRGLAVGPGYVELTSTNLSFSVSGDQLTLSWPADRIGWRLETQTNSLNVGLGTNWFDMSGSSLTNSVIMPVNVDNGSVFYRLIYP